MNQRDSPMIARSVSDAARSAALEDLGLLEIEPAAEFDHFTAAESRIIVDLAASARTLLELRGALRGQRLHDPLTGLPNRALTFAYAEQMSRTHGDGQLLAIAVGIDDLCGAEDLNASRPTDRVLTLVARRIERLLVDDDVLARLEEDLFIVLRSCVNDRTEALTLAHHIRAGISAEPVTARGMPVSVSATVAIAHGDRGGAGAAVVLRAAEALGRARDRRARVTIESDSRPPRSGSDPRMREALRGAVSREEITVAFQPIVELATGLTRGFEALARWTHPELGVVGPAEFIPVAEDSGEIVAIGEHVLRTACRQLVRWRAQSGQDLQVTVNLSPVQLGVPEIADVIGTILTSSGLPESALVLEISEVVIMAPGAADRRNLERIRKLGVQIALVDFGTGYSAITCLRRFPVDVIKIDRCFLDGLDTDDRDAPLMGAILAIGAGIAVEVVAEAVETRAQRELLRLSGCQLGQGFLFARPRPASEIRVGPRPASATPTVPAQTMPARERVRARA